MLILLPLRAHHGLSIKCQSGNLAGLASRKQRVAALTQSPLSYLRGLVQQNLVCTDKLSKKASSAQIEKYVCHQPHAYWGLFYPHGILSEYSWQTTPSATTCMIKHLCLFIFHLYKRKTLQHSYLTIAIWVLSHCKESSVTAVASFEHEPQLCLWCIHSQALDANTTGKQHLTIS